MKTIVTLVFVAATLVGCGKKKEEAATPPPTTGSAAGSDGSAAGSGSADTGSAGSAAAAAEAPVDVPTEVDFEGQATADITDKNVEAKLKTLETELSE
ncbi:MAG: hypothetical protein HOV81_27545 [Kofleriaceae bacterium]|nr:hypothetical protein [Kofleriaceae bacterium]